MSLRQGLGRWLRRRRFHGREHECVVCGSSVRTFLPFGEDLPILRELAVVGGGHRADGICPVCFCVDRERLLALYLISTPSLLAPGHRVLHVAPEHNLQRLLRASAGVRYTSGDRAAAGVSVRFDLQSLPFASATFDAIFCNHVLEHVPDDRRAMGELWRVLRPGGWAVLQVPVGLRLAATIEDPQLRDPAEQERRFGQRDHVRIYGADYADRLRAAGFGVETVAIQMLQGNDAPRRYGLDPNERLFIARRPR